MELKTKVCLACNGTRKVPSVYDNSPTTCHHCLGAKRRKPLAKAKPAAKLPSAVLTDRSQIILLRKELDVQSAYREIYQHAAKQRLEILKGVSEERDQWSSAYSSLQRRYSALLGEVNRRSNKM